MQMKQLGADFCTWQKHYLIHNEHAGRCTCMVEIGAGFVIGTRPWSTGGRSLLYLNGTQRTILHHLCPKLNKHKTAALFLPTMKLLQTQRNSASAGAQWSPAHTLCKLAWTKQNVGTIKYLNAINNYHLKFRITTLFYSCQYNANNQNARKPLYIEDSVIAPTCLYSVLFTFLFFQSDK